MTTSERLRTKLSVALPAFADVAWRLWDSPRIAPLYQEYLCTMHCIVRSSVPLMETAIARANELAPDPLAVGVEHGPALGEAGGVGPHVPLVGPAGHEAEHAIAPTADQ